MLMGKRRVKVADFEIAEKLLFLVQFDKVTRDYYDFNRSLFKRIKMLHINHLA